jgi:hypothetical protein
MLIAMTEPRPPHIKQFGLTQVYTPRGEPTVDIVFVHGLNGHPHDSWTSKSTGCFWPVDLLPDILAVQRPRILTYGYNANVTAFTDGVSKDTVVSHAETLASSLAANRYVSYRSICDCVPNLTLSSIVARLHQSSYHIHLPLTRGPSREAGPDLLT